MLAGLPYLAQAPQLLLLRSCRLTAHSTILQQHGDGEMWEKILTLTLMSDLLLYFKEKEESTYKRNKDC